MQGQTGDAAYGTDGSVVVTLRIPIELREALQRLAGENERTLSAEVRLAMKEHLRAAKVAA